MGWWRIRASDAADLALAEALHQAYRLHTLEAALHEKQLEQLVAWFQAAGIDPVLSKGWAIARLYPEPGLRPYGDFDFCVSSEQYAAATKIATEARGQGYPVDPHPGFRELQDRRFADLYVRSQSVHLGQVVVRLLGPEDHLRHLCIHFLSHGGWRPSWLCDLGALLEARPRGFDWDLCLHGSRTRVDWIGCALGLAHQLFGASLDGVPMVARSNRLPRWLVPTILTELGSEKGNRRQLLSYLSDPAGIFTALRDSWPNPVLATVERGCRFTYWPRLPIQLAQVAVRSAQLLAQLTSRFYTRPDSES